MILIGKTTIQYSCFMLVRGFDGVGLEIVHPHILCMEGEAEGEGEGRGSSRENEMKGEAELERIKQRERE